MHCYVTGASIQATLLAANTIIVTSGTATALKGALVATFQPLEEARQQGARSSVRLAEQRPKCMTVLYTRVIPSACDEGLGRQLAAVAEGVAYDMQATRMAVVATLESRAWWCEKGQCQAMSYFEARDAGVVCPWSLEEVVLLQRAIFSFDVHGLEVMSNEQRPPPTERVKFLVDGGANSDLVTDLVIKAMAHVTRSDVRIAGIWNAPGTVNEKVTFHLKLEGSIRAIQIDAPFTENARHNVLSESCLWDVYGARVLKEPVMKIKFPDGDADLWRENGLYFCYGSVVTEHSADNQPYDDDVTGKKAAMSNAYLANRRSQAPTPG